MPRKRSNPRFLVFPSTAILFFFFTSLSVIAQQAATSTLEGIVRDPAGAVVVNAAVTVKSLQTGATRETTTDESGVYRVPLLSPGMYELRIKAPNFASDRATLMLAVGQKLNYDVQLSVSGAMETVDITAQGPILETTRSSTSSSVNERAVSNLPVNGRNFLDFVTLTPGVVRDSRQGDLSFGGQKGTLNSIQIDGVDNNNMFFGQALGRTGSGRAPYQFSQDAVQEFQVNTNSFSAEFGRAAGGAINVVTKSGTNDFHGSVFEYYRDRALNANQLRFDATAGPNGAMVPASVKPPYHFNQFGAFIGGPIKKDKAFFFFNYDGQRSTQPNIVSFGAPAPPDADSQRGLALIQKYQQSYVRQFNQDVYLGKVDIQVSNANRLGLRYNRQVFTGTNLESSGPTSAFEHTGNSNVTTDSFAATLNSVFTSHFVNEFRVQLAKDREPGFANTDTPEANVNQGGRTVIVFGRNNFSPRETTEDKWQIIDNVSWSKRSHSVKGGFDINIEKILNYFPGQFGGRYFFDSYADYANGRVSRYAQAFAGAGTQGPTSHPDFNEYGFFVQDDWRAKSNLTLSLGVRYDVQDMKAPPVKNPDPRLLAAGIDTSFLKTDKNNIAPRFGFAWNPHDKLVVRGGYGMFYGRTPSIMLGTAHTQNGLSVVLIDLNRPTLPFAYPGRFTDLAQVAAFTPSIPSIFVFDKDFQQPYTQQASLGMEYEVNRDLVVGATYLRVQGTHIQRTRDINLLAPVSYPVSGGFPNIQRHPGVNGTPDRPIAGYARISQFESTGDSNYNALVLSINKRYSKNFQLSASYTWSKVIDNKPDATSVVPFNTGDDSKWVQQVFNLSDDRGVGEANIPHRFVASAVWDLNYFSGKSKAARAVVDGWQVSGILQAASNPPFSALVGSVDINNDGNRFTDRTPGFGRNTTRRDKFVSVDLRVAKTFYFTERFKLQLLGELFNAFNRVNYSLFNTQYASATVLTSVAGDPSVTTRNPRITITPRSDFGAPRAQFDYGLPGSARVGQLAAKFIF